MDGGGERRGNRDVERRRQLEASPQRDVWETLVALLLRCTGADFEALTDYYRNEQMPPVLRGNIFNARKLLGGYLLAQGDYGGAIRHLEAHDLP